MASFESTTHPTKEGQKVAQKHFETINGWSINMQSFRPISKVKEEREAAEREAMLQEREARAESKHEWISDPLETYGDYFYAFCSSFDLTKPLMLMKGDFVATTQIKEQYRRMIQDEVALVVPGYLQGEFYDGSLHNIHDDYGH